MNRPLPHRQSACSDSGCLSLSVASSSKGQLRRRCMVSRSQTYHPGVPLKDTRASMKPPRKKLVCLPRRSYSGSPILSKQQSKQSQLPYITGVPRVIVQQHQPFEDDMASLSTNEDDENELYNLLNVDLLQSDGTVVALALERLGSIFKHQPMSQWHQAIPMGAPSRLLEALARWNNDDRIARHGCHAIFRMVSSYTKQSSNLSKAALIETFLGLGGATILLRVLQNYSHSEEVQIYGMGALGSLFQQRGRSTRVVAHQLVLEQGGVAVVARAMQRFPQLAKLQEFGCWLLARLAYCLGKSHAPLFKVEGLVVVATAVQNNPQSVAIDQQASRFMALIFQWEQTTKVGQ